MINKNNKKFLHTLGFSTTMIAFGENPYFNKNSFAQTEKENTIKGTNLELRPAVLDPEYIKKWNIDVKLNYMNLYKDGVKLSDTLYRVGGLSHDLKDGYFKLIKHKEALYEQSIEKDKNKQRHLSGHHCILNIEGVEKFVVERFDHVYLIGGPVYSTDKGYFNIKTGELYCKTSTAMKTENFIFLHNDYDDDKSRRGMMKINKVDGSYEILN